MNKTILILCIVIAGCNHSLYKSKIYKIAKQELEYLNHTDNYKLMSAKTLRYNTAWFFNKDTIVLQKGDKTFGFKNKLTKDVYVFEFYDDNWHRRIKFDSLWQIVEYKSLTGMDYNKVLNKPERIRR